MAKKKYNQTVKKRNEQCGPASAKVAVPPVSSVENIETTVPKTTSETSEAGQNNRQQSHKPKKGWVKIIAIVLRFLMKKPVAASVKPKTTSEKSSSGQDKKKRRSSKPKKGLVRVLARKLGYVKRDQEALWINDIYKKVAAESMDEKKFAALSQEEKIKALTDRLEQLASAQKPKTQTNVNVLVETENTAEVEVQNCEKADEKTTESGVNSADTAQRDVPTETMEMQSSDNNRAVQRTVETGQKERNQSKEDATCALENQSLDSDGQEGTDELGKATKMLETECHEHKEKNETIITANTTLEGEKTTLNEEKGELKRKNEELNTKFQDLERKYATLEEKKGEVDGKYNTLQAEHDTLTRISNELQTAHDQYKARCEELEASEVGQLETTIKEKDQEITRLQEGKTAVENTLVEIKAAKETVDRQLQEACQTIENQKGKLKEKEDAIITLNSTIEKQEKQIGDLTTEKSKLNAEIEEQKKELAARQTVIGRQTEEIVRLENDKNSLQNKNTELNLSVEGLQKEKNELTLAKEQAEQELVKKNELICTERDDLAKIMMSLVKKLSVAAAEDFLGCCDDNFENNRTNLQEKVLKPIRRLEREMAEVNPGKYVSRDELAEAYHALIKSQFDEASGLTRIAQWYAYSQVAFMVDKDRADGLFIYQEKVRDMYRLAVRLMGNVGLEYCLPALYSEHLSGNSPYDNVTGQRQLNIEYMCPTARGRKENIDCIDRSQVIIDIVEVGYTDTKGVSKKSQVII